MHNTTYSFIILANSRALSLLEKEAKGEFQAIPIHIIMPDGFVIKDYKLINIINKAKMLIPEKSILSKRQCDFDPRVKLYDKCYYDLYGLGEANLAIDSEKIAFFGSDKLKKAVKKAKLKGLNFTDRRGNSFFFHDEDSYQEDRIFDEWAAQAVKEKNEKLYPYTEERKKFMQDMLKSFPEVEKERDDVESGELYIFNMDLVHFGRLLGKAIRSEKNELSKQILEKIEKFLEKTDAKSKEMVTYDLFQETIRSLSWEGDRYYKVFVGMLKPLSKECCREVANRMKIKMPGLNA